MTGPADFWLFFALREQARVRREANDPLLDGSYSHDPILKRYHFCNVFREADAGTKWFHRHRNTASGSHTLWQSLCYRPVNRVATFEAWHAECVPAVAGRYKMIPPPIDKKAWLAFLKKRMKNGDKVFTGRHLNRGYASYAQTLNEADRHLDSLWLRILRARDLEDVCAELRTVHGIGAFFAWQVACDLVEAGLVNDTGDWAQLGPGAVRGARLVAEGTDQPTGSPLDTARWLVATQHHYVGIYSTEQWLRPHVDLKTIEHALCEYVRYHNARSGNPCLEVKPWAKKQ